MAMSLKSACTTQPRPCLKTDQKKKKRGTDIAQRKGTELNSQYLKKIKIKNKNKKPWKGLYIAEADQIHTWKYLISEHMVDKSEDTITEQEHLSKAIAKIIVSELPGPEQKQ